jgi:hypothetical protein
MEIAKYFEEHLCSGEHYLRVNQRIFMLSSAHKWNFCAKALHVQFAYNQCIRAYYAVGMTG